jgi:hypothetical protein
MNVLDNGGNPGAHIESTTISGQVNHLLLNMGYAWNPAINGALESITLAVDVSSVSGWGQGQGIYAILRQDSQNFIAPGIATGSNTNWHQVVLGPYAEQEFSLLTGVFQTDDSVHPDFARNAPPIRFGFATGNSNSGQYTQKYDNWAVTVSTASNECGTCGALIVDDAIFAHDFESINNDIIHAAVGPDAIKAPEIAPDSTDPVRPSSSQHIQAPDSTDFVTIDTMTQLQTPTCCLSFSLMRTDRGDNGSEFGSTLPLSRYLSAFNGTGFPPFELLFQSEETSPATRRFLFGISDAQQQVSLSSDEFPSRDGLWHQVGFVLETTPDGGILTFYFDGQPLGDSLAIPTLTEIPPMTYNWHLIEDATNVSAPEEYFDNGDYDEAVLWNRALCPAEMKQLYEHGFTAITTGISSDAVGISSSSSVSALPVMGTLADQLAALNAGPPPFDPNTWFPVARQNVNSNGAFVCDCAGVDPNLDCGGMWLSPDPLAEPYVSAQQGSYLLDADEVALDNCSSAFYRFTFDLPANAINPSLSGVANVDDQAVVFLNGNQISGTMHVPPCERDPFLGPFDPCYDLQDAAEGNPDMFDDLGRQILTWPTQDPFGTVDAAYFVPGENELVFAVAGDASFFEPTGLEFEATVTYDFGGDSDCDGDLDLRDFARLQACFTGDTGVADSGCLVFDFDSDADVALDDFARFTDEITGPN